MTYHGAGPDSRSMSLRAPHRRTEGATTASHHLAHEDDSIRGTADGHRSEDSEPTFNPVPGKTRVTLALKGKREPYKAIPSPSIQTEDERPDG